MTNETFENGFGLDMTATHSVAFYGIDTSNIGFIKNSTYFNVTTDLSGSADEDLGDRVISAISSFGVTGVQVHSIECGPVVTRVNLKLPHGVRIKTIEALADDIAMQLQVKCASFTSVSEKGVLALDIPAKERKVVRLGNVHTANTEGMALPLELGVTVNGEARAIDLAKAPHLLIAGQTGSGKSVCINSLLCSLLRNVSLNDFELMLVDPKGVELNDYQKMPNCINGKILVDPNESLDGLRWLVTEMERRYAILTKYGHRNIKSYNEWVNTQPIGVDCVEKMRYVVCVVDEFADLMMTAGAELTSIVQRLAQKSRAVGIHLVLATQRPSVKVVTGDLKANLPCRIAFKVSSATDSVTILGHGGAERLLGNGDMILSNNDADERLHGVYINDDEIRLFTRVVFSCTINSISIFHDYVNGTTTNSLNVPSWLIETMSECRHRQLGVVPYWLRCLVDINRKVWVRNVEGNKFNLGVLIARMAAYYKEVDAFRSSIAHIVNDTSAAHSQTFLDNVEHDAMETLLRLKTSSVYGFGFSMDDIQAAYNRTSPINASLTYLNNVA
jgi:hypothetical protein